MPTTESRSTGSSSTELRLTVVLERRGPAAAIVLTDEQVATLGPSKVFPVAVTIGGVTAQLRLARMGGENLVGLNKAVRAQLGVGVGDTVDAIVARDREPREIIVPEALTAVLDADPAARAAFDALPPSRRKEHVRLVAEAKRDETRQRRVAAIVESLR